MKTISKSRLKAHMLEEFRKIEQSGEPLIVTDRGEPVLRIEPFRKTIPIEVVFRDISGKIRYRGDIMEPTTDEWNEV